MGDLIIVPRPQKPEKCQVRFWTHPDKYAEFKEACEAQGVLVQDAFTQFIEWYVKENRE